MMKKVQCICTLKKCFTHLIRQIIINRKHKRRDNRDINRRKYVTWLRMSGRCVKQAYPDLFIARLLRAFVNGKCPRGESSHSSPDLIWS